MHRGIRASAPGALFVAALLIPLAPADAAPLAGASDTATPNYNSSFTPSPGTNEFACRGGGCTMSITTKTTPYPCASELIVLSDSATPGLLYRDTHCSVSIIGRFALPFEEQGSPACVLEAAQTLTVTFSSGANSAFNGTFPATGSFKPTSVTASGYIRSAIVSVKAGGPLEGHPTGTGEVKASFQVRFGGLGLSPSCYAASSSGLSTLSAGTVVTRF